MSRQLDDAALAEADVVLGLHARSVSRFTFHVSLPPGYRSLYGCGEQPLLGLWQKTPRCGGRKQMRRGVAALAAAFALAGCSSESGGEPADEPAGATTTEPAENSDDDVYIKKVRAAIPGAAAYDDDVLHNMAENVCALGSVELGVQVLDNYSQIEAEDREELAAIALKTAC